MRTFLVAFLLFVSSVITAASAAEGNVAAGEQVFRKCAACHSLVPGQNKTGPSLAGVIGRTAGTLPGYNYSTAMQRSGIVWTPETLDRYLVQPFRVVEGTKMLFTGLARAEDRANVIAYLEAASQQGQAPEVAAAAPAPAEAAPPGATEAAPAETAQAAPEATAEAPTPATTQQASAGYGSNVRYTLKTGIAEGRMVFIGVGGEVDGVVNPTLKASEGDTLQITLINGEGAVHDIAFPEQKVESQKVLGKGASTTVAFQVKAAGDFVYYCTLPGHREAGMEGKLAVSQREAPQPVAKRNIPQDPTAVPPPITRREPARVQVNLESVELEGRLADGTTYQYWTFNGTVPGPFVRVRVGDTVEVTLKNDVDSAMIHSIDFHAATGPGGGAAHLQVDPGDEKKIEFKALVPGIYVYHCATPMVAHHIANGMYGLILVEPENGLPKVDHEFYVMQGEVYTDKPFGEHGNDEFSVEKLLDEKPEYFVFNGAVGALTNDHPLKAKAGETVRIFFGDGGPNFTSSFHVIGEIFDRVYTLGDLIDPPLRGVQTVTVPPGGAVVTEFKVDVPGRYVLVDHALARAERGLLGFLLVEGQEKPEIYKHYSPAEGGD